MFGRIRIAAVTCSPRHSVVSGVTLALGEIGWVVDSHQFSNIAIALHFELPRAGVRVLRRTLSRLPIEMSEESVRTLEGLEFLPVQELPDPISGSLHITFVHSEPDIRITVPAVPG